jgi:hypothetical protein
MSYTMSYVFYVALVGGEFEVSLGKNTPK